MKKHLFLIFVLVGILLASCSPVDLNAPVPTIDTGVDPNAWVTRDEINFPLMN